MANCNTYTFPRFSQISVTLSSLLFYLGYMHLLPDLTSKILFPLLLLRLLLIFLLKVLLLHLSFSTSAGIPAFVSSPCPGPFLVLLMPLTFTPFCLEGPAPVSSLFSFCRIYYFVSIPCPGPFLFLLLPLTLSSALTAYTFHSHCIS